MQCSPIRALLNHHQRCFLLKKMETNTETHNIMPSMRDPETLCTKRLVSINSPLPPSKLRGRKSVRARGDWGLQENKMIKAHMYSQRLNQQAQGIHRSVPGPVRIYYRFKFYGISECANKWVSDSRDFCYFPSVCSSYATLI